MADDILLVDDEPGIRKIIRISLEDLGYSVLEAEHGKAALNLFLERRPAIVLTDIKMPEMDGITLLDRIKRVDPETEVILFTGHGDMDDAIQSLKFDATDFITKPIDVKVLQIALKRAKERIVLRNRLREYTETLEKLVAEKTGKLIEAERLAAAGEVVAGLSHTIKHIATGLKGSIYVSEDALARDDIDQVRQGLDMIKENVDKIAGLSMDMLNYRRYAGIHRRMADPNEAAMAVLNLVSPRAASRGIALRTSLAQHLSPVSMDPDSIHCCLLNLLTNAMDACECRKPEGEKTIEFQTLPYGQRGVEYRVADNGCGMSRSIRQRVFAEFFTTKGSRGTGLGLKTAKHIVDLHGGEIGCHTDEGKGSVFFIRLDVHG
ncbi:MAG: hybrid sensor histidine kinase/response regulator [Desulfobacterales bacterium]